MLSKELYRTYVQILKDELVPAMGCTEPIAIAYAGAVARKTLGVLPDRVEVAVSRNIIKNVKSVVVPHTGGLRGIEAAAVAGIVAGDAAKELEVISHVEQEDIEAMGNFLKEVPCSVCEASSDLIFDIQITLYHGEDEANVRITDFHTNLVHVSRNGEILLAKEITGKEESALADKSTLTTWRSPRKGSAVITEPILERFCWPLTAIRMSRCAPKPWRLPVLMQE